MPREPYDILADVPAGATPTHALRLVDLPADPAHGVPDPRLVMEVLEHGEPTGDEVTFGPVGIAKLMAYLGTWRGLQMPVPADWRPGPLIVPDPEPQQPDVATVAEVLHRLRLGCDAHPDRSTSKPLVAYHVPAAHRLMGEILAEAATVALARR